MGLSLTAFVLRALGLIKVLAQVSPGREISVAGIVLEIRDGRQQSLICSRLRSDFLGVGFVHQLWGQLNDLGFVVAAQDERVRRLYLNGFGGSRVAFSIR